MNINTLVYTQIAAVLTYVGTLFGLYRMLIQQKESVIQQKDSVIQLLKENVAERDFQIAALKSQTPDALASALAERIKMSLDEISRLKIDGHSHLQEIAQKEEELRSIQHRLSVLGELIQDSDLVCPDCGAPLIQREEQSQFMEMGGRDFEHAFEFRRYGCGLSVSDEEEISPCEHRVI
ncbi:hypothetical protein [Pseudomonas monsensis]